jgi:hypothetical protein
MRELGARKLDWPLRERSCKVGISINEIGLNKCYVTALGQVRRVLKFGNGRVTYESRGKKTAGGSWGEQNTVSDGRFAQDVEREVPCDFSI